MKTSPRFPLVDTTQCHIECADNLEFMRQLPDESMQLVVTSPPYNNGKSYEQRRDLDDCVDMQTEVIAECLRLLNSQESICWQVGNHVDGGEVFPLDVTLYSVFKRDGLNLRNRIDWQLGHGLHCSKRFRGRHETTPVIHKI